MYLELIDVYLRALHPVVQEQSSGMSHYDCDLQVRDAASVLQEYH